MKKSLYLPAVVIATVFVLFFCLVVTASAFATDLVITVTDYRAGENDRYISICVTGQDLHFFSTEGIPFVDTQNRIQVPVQKFAEAIGGTVQYNVEEKSVTITKLHDTVLFHIGSNRILCNGTEQEMDTTVQNIGGRTYIPIRALSEALGYRVEYRAEKATSADYRISRNEVVSGEICMQPTIGPNTSVVLPTPLNSEELDKLMELYNQMCMSSPRYEIDRFDTVHSYADWVYLTMQDGSKVDLCLRMQDEWEIRCFAGPNEKDNFIMHSPDLYMFIANLYDSE